MNKLLLLFACMILIVPILVTANNMTDHYGFTYWDDLSLCSAMNKSGGANCDAYHANVGNVSGGGIYTWNGLKWINITVGGYVSFYFNIKNPPHRYNRLTINYKLVCWTNTAYAALHWNKDYNSRANDYSFGRFGATPNEFIRTRDNTTETDASMLYSTFAARKIYNITYTISNTALFNRTGGTAFYAYMLINGSTITKLTNKKSVTGIGSFDTIMMSPSTASCAWSALRIWPGNTTDEPAISIKPSTVSLNYPANNSHQNDVTWNRTFILTTNKRADCTVNHTSWTLARDNQTTFNFNRGTIPADRQYIIKFMCNNSGSYWRNATINITIDNTNPNILFANRIPNNSYWNSSVSIGWSAADTYLWKVNTTIKNATSAKQFFSRLNGSIIGTYYNLTKLIFNNASYKQGNYSLKIEAVDSHTALDFQEGKTMEIISDKKDATENTLTQKTKAGDFIISYSKDVSIEPIIEQDKISYRIGTDYVGEKTISLYSENIVYLKNSGYPCHFVIPIGNGMTGYWFDCVGLIHPKVIPGKNEHMYDITFEAEEIDFKMESFGGLNYVSKTMYLYYDTQNPNFTHVPNNATRGNENIYFKFNTTELTNYSYKVGLTCAGAAITTGKNISYNIEHRVYQSGLLQNTTYWFNITIFDRSGRTRNRCFNYTTRYSIYNFAPYNLNYKLIGYWKMQESVAVGSGVLMNSIFSKDNFTIEGTPALNPVSRVNGIIGFAQNFSKTDLVFPYDHYFTWAHTDKTYLSRNYSLSFWYFNDGNIKGVYDISLWSYSSWSAARLDMYLSLSYGQVFLCYNHSTPLTNCLTWAIMGFKNSLTNKQWNLVTLVTNGSYAYIYINGQKVNTTYAKNAYFANRYSSIVLNKGGTTVPLYSTLTIDELGAWNKSLSFPEIAALYNSGSPSNVSQYPYLHFLKENVKVEQLPYLNKVNVTFLWNTSIIADSRVNISKCSDPSIKKSFSSPATTQYHVINATVLNQSTLYCFTAESCSINKSKCVYLSGNFTTPSKTNLSIRFYDEKLNKLLTWENITVQIVGLNGAFNYSTVNGRLNISNITTGDYTIYYSASSYFLRTYYINLVASNSPTLKLFLLNQTDGSRIILKIYDENSDNAPNITVTLERQYGLTFQTVSMSRSNFEGEAIIYAELYDVWYRLVYSDLAGNVLKISDPSPFNRIDPTDQINLQDRPFASFAAYDDMRYNLSVINVTNKLYYRLLYSSTSGLARGLCLNVKRTTTSGILTICNNCTSSASGSITCYINHTRPGEYMATALIDTNSTGSWYTLDMFMYKLVRGNPTGQEGAFLMMILIGSLGFMGLSTITGSIILLILGLALAAISGFVVGLGWGSLSMVIVVGGIIIFFISKRGSQ